MATRTAAWPWHPAIGLLVLLVGLLPCTSCQRRSSDASSPCVVVYCSVDQDLAESILDEFHRQTGIRVLARYDSEAVKTVGLVQRLRNESDAPSADVFWSSEVFYTIQLANEGLFEKSAGPGGLSDPQGRWAGFALRARVIAYNTQRLTAAEAPTRLEDLLQPRFKGRMVMARPQFGTTGGDVASWFVHYGRERGRQILHGLADNQVQLVDGNSTVVRLVASGAADVGLADTDDVYAAGLNGRPVAMNPLDQGGEGVLAIPNSAAIVKGCPHPQQARALMAFLLSRQVEAALARSDSHFAPTDPVLAEDKEFAPYRIAKPLKVDYARIAEELPEALRAAGEILH